MNLTTLLYLIDSLREENNCLVWMVGFEALSWLNDKFLYTPLYPTFKVIIKKKFFFLSVNLIKGYSQILGLLNDLKLIVFAIFSGSCD